MSSFKHSITTLSFCLSGLAFAGAGSSGGGIGIRNGQLRDFETEAALNIGSLKDPDLKVGLAKMQDYLSHLSPLNPILSQKIFSELGYVTEVMMMDAPLTSLRNQDRLAKTSEDYEQIGIRIYDDEGRHVNGPESRWLDHTIQIAINREIYLSLSPDQQGAFWLHEILHSFVKKEPEISYYTRLDFAVASIVNSATSSKHLTPEAFQKMARFSKLEFVDWEEDLLGNYIFSGDPIVEVIKEQLPNNKSFNDRALRSAAMGGQEKWISFFIERGADLNSTGENSFDALGKTPLAITLIYAECASCAQTLVRAGANPLAKVTFASNQITGSIGSAVLDHYRFTQSFVGKSRKVLEYLSANEIAYGLDRSQRKILRKKLN